MLGNFDDHRLRALVVQRLAQGMVEEGERASTSCSTKPSPAQYQSRVGRPSVLHRLSARRTPSGWSAAIGTARIRITRLPTVCPPEAIVGTS